MNPMEITMTKFDGVNLGTLVLREKLSNPDVCRVDNELARWVGYFPESRTTACFWMMPGSVAKFDC